MQLAKAVMLLSLLTSLCFVPSYARNMTLQDPQTDVPVGPPQDPISQLRLTPEQREKIRAIRAQNKEERALISQRLRESNFALEQALDSDNPNEAEIEQLLKNVASAQAASTRMRVTTELQVRRVLTQEQLILWRRLRLQAAGRRPIQDPGVPPADRMRQNQGNGMAPLFQRRNQLRRNPRP